MVDANSANRLVEQFLVGATTLGAGQSVSLGVPVNPAILNNQSNTLAFRFGGAAYDSEGIGQVIFQDLSTLAGDYNGNGVVDTADYVMWQPNAFGGDPGGSTPGGPTSVQVSVRAVRWATVRTQSRNQPLASFAVWQSSGGRCRDSKGKRGGCRARITPPMRRLFVLVRQKRRNKSLQGEEMLARIYRILLRRQ